MIDQEKKTIHRRILLLGGTGAMGEHLTRILAEQGDDVYVTTRSCRLSERNITYVQGNAHEITFINDLLRESWDAIVDFMVYNTDEFRVRVSQLLKATKQYIFISSARVYGPTTSSDELMNMLYQKPDRRIFFTRQVVIIGLLSDLISLLVKHDFSLGYLKRRIGFGVL